MALQLLPLLKTSLVSLLNVIFADNDYNVNLATRSVVQSLDNAIHRMNSIQWISVNKTNYAFRWIVIYTLDVNSVIYLSNNLGLIIFWRLYIVVFLSFEVKTAYEPSDTSTQRSSWFCSMKQPGVFLLPLRWDASPSQRYPQHYVHRYPFIHLGGERHCEGYVSCPRTQHNVPSQGSNPEASALQ